MKTPLPEPAYTDSGLYEPTAFTESQLRAAMVAAWNEAIEEAAKHLWHMYQQTKHSHNYYQCASMEVRELKEQTP